MKHRGQRVDDLIRAELARILQREIKDPRVQLASVASVKVSRDLKYATVNVSVLGEDDERRLETIEALRQAKGFIRTQLARSLSLRTVPDLKFELDRGAEHSQKISEILENLNDDPQRS